MADDNYSFLILEQNKSNKEEDSEYELNHFKSKEKYKLDKFEIFDSKTKENNKENEKILKGAENQVKLLLSNFMKNIQSEKDDSDNVYDKIKSYKKNNDIGINSTRKKSIENIRTSTYRKYLRYNSNKMTNNLLLNKNKSNKYPFKGNKSKAFLSSHNIKRVKFSISPRRKLIKKDPQKVGTNENYLNHNNIDNNLNIFHSEKNTNLFNENPNSIKKNELNRKALIKKTYTHRQNENYINFKSDDIFISNNNNQKEKSNKKIVSLKNFVNNIINNIKQINKSKVAHKNSIKTPKLNKLKIKDSINNNEIIEQRCYSPKVKRSSLFKKQQIMLFGENEDTKSKMKSSNKIIQGINNINKMASLKKIRHSETTKNNLDISTQDIDKIKFLKLISNFNSLKQKIKKNIILRPEVEIEDKKDYKINNSRKKLLTTDKIINIKNMLCDNTNKTKKNMLHSNTITYTGDECETKKETNLNNIENETKQIIENKEKKKNETFNVKYTFHRIKRKNAFHFERYRMLSRKGAIYDSLDDEEIEDEEEIYMYYIDPNSNFCFYFDLILFFFTFISFFEVPLYLAKNINFCRSQIFSVNDSFNLLIEIVNILDLIFGFFRAFYNWEEQLIKKSNVIAKKYLFSWFLLDLICAIPVYSIIKIKEPLCEQNKIAFNYNIILNNIHYLFICNRLFKLIKVLSFNQAWKYISSKLNDFCNLIFNICIIFLALNYTACLYIFIARNTYPNWLLKARLEISDFTSIYICALYILLMALTTVGYGDITCYSLIERIFQIFLLFIGIIAYSWIISSFSNFIKKLNEKFISYEKKKYTLDEIKMNNPNLPDKLYDKILRYLKFRYFHEQNLRNIIFDCLPVGLKNNLICEMYKPIIKNFIFFKNFENTDFIVQVILSFKPTIAYKNYILVNEGDLIEDIMFVKHGVLSVELPINITNPQENIDKYLNKSILDKEKSKLKNTLKKKNDTFSSFIGEAPKKLMSFNNSSTINSSFNYKSSFIGNKSLLKAKTVKEEKIYVKILCIRDNEHFGDVLIFLEERSPLQVRVRSKKCELFFLKKIDALRLSNIYPNIWRRINKKSVYNFKQIKKSVKKIVEIYCCAKKINEKNKEVNELPDEFGLKNTGIWGHPKNYDFNNSALNSPHKNFEEKQNKSEKDLKIKTKNLFTSNKNIDEDYFNDADIKNKIKSVKKCHSARALTSKLEEFLPQSQKLLNPISFSDSSSSSNIIKRHKPKKKVKKSCNRKSKEKKLSKQLFELFNCNSTNSKDTNEINKPNKDDHLINIIAEETDKDFSLNPNLDNSNSNSVYKNSINSKSKIMEYESLKSLINRDGNSKNDKTQKNKVKQSLSTLTQKKSDNLEKIKNKEILSNYSEDNSYKENNESKINNEIYPGELIQIHNADNLMDKKVNYNIDYNIENIFIINSNNENNNRNTEVVKLLKYFDEESKSINNNSSEKSSFIYNSSKNVSKNKNDSNKLIFNHKNEIISETSKMNSNSSVNLNFKPKWDANIFSINNDISITINSSYENYNVISRQKLIKSKLLQNKLKSYLINEIINGSNRDKKNNDSKKAKSFIEDKEKIILQDLTQKRRMPSSIVYNTTNINYINNVSVLKKKSKNDIRTCASFLNKNKSVAFYSELDNTSSNFLKKKMTQKQIDRRKTETEINGNSSRNIFKFNRKFERKKVLQPFINSSKNLKIFNISRNKSFNILDSPIPGRVSNNETSKELPRRIRMKRRNSVLISSHIYRRKRKKEDDLLSLIDYNIQRTNQKLNEPELFYNNYFSNILREEKEKIKKK